MKAPHILESEASCCEGNASLVPKRSLFENIVLAVVLLIALLVASMVHGTPATNYLGGYTPSFGDTLDLVDWSSTDPALASLFDFSAAPAGYEWDTSNFLSTGSVALTPEPGRFVLLMLGVCGLVFRRQRRGSEDAAAACHSRHRCNDLAADTKGTADGD